MTLGSWLCFLHRFSSIARRRNRAHTAVKKEWGRRDPVGVVIVSWGRGLSRTNSISLHAVRLPCQKLVILIKVNKIKRFASWSILKSHEKFLSLHKTSSGLRTLASLTPFASTINQKFSDQRLFSLFIWPLEICPAGSYFSTEKATCVECPLGTYQPVQGQMKCILCDKNLTTALLGAVEESYCIGNVSLRYANAFIVLRPAWNT